MIGPCAMSFLLSALNMGAVGVACISLNLLVGQQVYSYEANNDFDIGHHWSNNCLAHGKVSTSTCHLHMKGMQYCHCRYLHCSLFEQDGWKESTVELLVIKSHLHENACLDRG
jgi:hypothetical protein